MSKFIITTSYKFSTVYQAYELKEMLLAFCSACNIKGTILIAEEGVNINLAGKRDAIDAFYEFCKNKDELSNIDYKECGSSFLPFRKMKIKIKDDIIKLDSQNLDTKHSGTYLTPSQWDNLLNNPESIVIDSRNDYEVAFGSFASSVDPKIRNFSDLPQALSKILKDVSVDTPVGMFCTGGIRCEKSTAYMKKMGFKNVYHLKGGIIKYLQDQQKDNSMWQGKCFVFDDRIAIDSSFNPAFEDGHTHDT